MFCPIKSPFPKNSIARVTIFTAKEEDYLQPVYPALLTNYFNDSTNSLISDTTAPPYMSSDEYWFPTPENFPDPKKLEGINKRIFEEKANLKNKKK